MNIVYYTVYIIRLVYYTQRILYDLKSYLAGGYYNRTKTLS